MDLYWKARLACAEGMSRREAVRHFNISRDRVAKIMAFSVPPGYRRSAPVKRPKLEAFTGIIGGIEQKAHLFVMDMPHSDACYVRAYPAATAEAWVDGHVHAFAFFGKVPASVLYDNDRCLVAKILPDGTCQRATLFSGWLAWHSGRPTPAFRYADVLPQRS